MPTASKTAQAAEPAEPMPVPSYPQIEGFIETATADEVVGLFEPLKESLAALKGPRAEHAKKVNKAIARTEELLQHLLQVREKLQADSKRGR